MGTVATPRLGLEVPDGDELDDVPTWMLSLATQLDGMVGPTDHGLLADRPTSTVGTPGIADRTYFATDVDPADIVDPATDGQLFRDNGTGWDAIGPYVSKMNMGTFAPPGSTGNQDILGVGFKPKMVKFWWNFTDQSDAAATWGEGAAISSSNRWAMFMRATSSSYQRRFNVTRCIFEVSDVPASVTYAADFVQFLADGFRLNWVVASGGTRLIAWQAWG